jgi:NADH-quinone oxidoreductase subunit J
MDLGAFAFYVVAAITLAASLGVVVTRSVVYSALLLVAALMFTGLIYLMLLADFLALVQILIYGGTVSVLLLFALMLTRPQEKPLLNHRGWPAAALAAVVLFGVLIYQSVGTTWAPAGPASTGASPSSIANGARTTAPGPPGTASTTARTPASSGAATTGPRRVGPADLGNALFTTWGVPFEIASLVLLVALMGSLVIARGTPEPHDPTDVPEAPGALEAPQLTEAG